MGRSSTVSVLFTDIVGSTGLLAGLGDHVWDGHRRDHFAALREALAAHGGTEVKNTGDGMMAVFDSAVDLVECALAMQAATRRGQMRGSPVTIRVGGSTGEAIAEQGDWFGTPVVQAARLCAAAQAGEVLVTAVVGALGQSADASFERVGELALKGFTQPVEALRVSAAEARRTMFADTERVSALLPRLVQMLDYWETLPDIQAMRAQVMARLALLPGDRVCDIGCGTGTELVRLAGLIGPSGRAVGVDTGAAMLDEARVRAGLAGVDVDLHHCDGRDTGLAAGSFDAVRMERVVQHTGEVERFVAEARRLLRPGGRFVVADTDWGSWMIHPGDRHVARRLKGAMELGPMGDAWAGRTLHAALVAGGFTSVSSTMVPIRTAPGIMSAMGPVVGRFVQSGTASQAEVDTFVAEIEAALDDGSGVMAFVMFIASGVRGDGLGC